MLEEHYENLKRLYRNKIKKSHLSAYLYAPQDVKINHERILENKIKYDKAIQDKLEMKRKLR